MRLPYAVAIATLLSTLLNACAPVVVGGAAATGGTMAADRRTSGAYVEDEGIEWKTLIKIRENLGDKIHVNATSFNRHLLLTGEAIDTATKEKAGTLAKEIANVRSVTNELEIGGASTMAARSNDTYLTGKVKTALLQDKRIQANFVKVVTENSVVYLMGMVTRQEADIAVEIARGTSGVRKVVKVFEYVIEQ